MWGWLNEAEKVCIFVSSSWLLSSLVSPTSPPEGWGGLVPHSVQLVSPHGNIWITILLNWNHDWTKWTDVNVLRMINDIILFRKDLTSVRRGWWMVTGRIWRFKFNFLILIQRKWPVTRWSLATTEMLFIEFRGWTCTPHNELAMTHLHKRDQRVYPRPKTAFPCFPFVVGR